MTLAHLIALAWIATVVLVVTMAAWKSAPIGSIDISRKRLAISHRGAVSSITGTQEIETEEAF